VLEDFENCFRPTVMAVLASHEKPTASGVKIETLGGRVFGVQLQSKSLVSSPQKIMNPQQIAESFGLSFTRQTPGYLNLCVRSGNQLLTSGHVSDLKGKLGADLQTEDGYTAARNCAEKILNSVWNCHGTLDGLKVVKVLGCVNSTLDFTDQHLVINGCSDLLHQVFGKEGNGFHARSALGFVQLPMGAAVEVEAIFEVL
jgi:hypothetical protein